MLVNKHAIVQKLFIIILKFIEKYKREFVILLFYLAIRKYFKKCNEIKSYST